jgi:DNA-binding transcriptional LysR family regulator
MDDLDSLDLKLLRLLDVLYRTGSVTRSADALGQGQPTVSLWLKRLRDQFGDPLFVRTAAGMQPTPRMDAMIDTVREVLDGMRRLSDAGKGFDPASAEREFRILMTDASHITLLPRLFSQVHALAPQVRIEAGALHAGMAEELSDGRADLALGLIPQLDTGFYQQTLFDQDWICLASRRHPRVRPDSFTRRDYAREAHVGIVSGTGQQLLEATLQAQRLPRRVALRLPGFLGLPATLSTTQLIATLPRHIGETLARTASGLQVLPCPLPIPKFQVKQHWHARYHRDPANQWLRGVCAALFLAADRRSPAAI